MSRSKTLIKIILLVTYPQKENLHMIKLVIHKTTEMHSQNHPNTQDIVKRSKKPSKHTGYSIFGFTTKP